MAGEIQSWSVDERDRKADASRRINELGDQFLASLNHDIRTPLSGILGMTDLLMETELTEEQKEYVSTTRLCADQLMEMLGSALEYAALASGNFRLEKTEFHLPQAIEMTVNEFRPKAQVKGLRLVCELPENLPAYVVGDAVRLRQALSPLLANAVKFTPRGGGEVKVTAQAGGLADRGITLVISVRDTGIGIPKDKLTAIFESFRQLESGLSRTHDGMGLGLAFARKLARLMGGNIAVDSQPGAGSTLHLTLPIELPPDKEAGLVAETGALSPSETARHRILLVDDNEVARRIGTHVLTRAGYDVECAEGGAEGIQAAAKRRYDLILMDLQMPGVNGLEATSAIRRLPGYAATPILALTANYSEEFERKYGEAGLQGFLTKPIERERLVAALEQHLT